MVKFIRQIVGSFLENISYFSHLLPLVIFLLFIKRNKEIWARVIFIYIIYSFLNDNLLLYVDPDKEKVTYILLIAYTVAEYSLFSFFFLKILENRKIKRVILVCSILFYFFIFFYFLAHRGGVFDTISASIESILILIYCIFYFFEQLNKVQNIFIYQTSAFWFVIGFMVYLSANFFLFIQVSSLSQNVRDSFWNINLFSNVLKNIFFTIAFLIPKAQVGFDSMDNSYEHLFEKPN